MRVNGIGVELPADWHGARLLDLLRDHLELRGTKEGCGVGECGSCTVVVDGETVCSCLVLAGQVAEADVETVEGLRDHGGARLQDAFVEHQAVQCGYCIPGMLMSARTLLAHTDDPDDDQIRDALGGNLCRCTGYNRFHDAIHAAARDTAATGNTAAAPNTGDDPTGGVR